MTDHPGCLEIEAAEYLPFGLTRKQTGTEVTYYKFTDQELDAATGLYNYDARLYDPVVGRFITGDSVIPNWFDPQLLNRYSYVRNNPLRYKDPDGHIPVETVLDVVSLGDSVVSIVRQPSWANAGFLAWDVVGLIPYVPGSWAGKAVKYGKQGVEKLAKEGAEKAVKEVGEKASKKTKTHGNVLDDKPAEGYTLRDRDTGDVKKYGETTRGEDNFGPGKQKRYSKKYLKENDVDYVKETSGTKKEMHQWQHEKILGHKEKYGQRPDLNKSDY